MESIITIVIFVILVIVVYGLKIYEDKKDLKKCTKIHLKKEKKKDTEEKILLNNIDSLSYLDFLKYNTETMRINFTLIIFIMGIFIYNARLCASNET